MTTRYFIAFVCVVSIGCGAALTSQDKSELAEYKAQLSACLAAHPSNVDAQNACKKQVQEDWYRQWNQRFDGGFE